MEQNMEQNFYRDALIERRQNMEENNEWWEKLTLSQKFSARSLAKYGYELAYIRDSASGNLAVMLQENNVSTIAEDGDIDTNPEINVR